jgi:hypothetical protein
MDKNLRLVFYLNVCFEKFDDKTWKVRIKLIPTDIKQHKTVGIYFIYCSRVSLFTGPTGKSCP